MENNELKQLRQNIKDRKAERILKAQQERDAKRALGEYFVSRAKILEQRGIWEYVSPQTQGGIKYWDSFEGEHFSLHISYCSGTVDCQVVDTDLYDSLPLDFNWGANPKRLRKLLKDMNDPLYSEIDEIYRVLYQ